MKLIVGRLVRCPYCGKWSVIGYTQLQNLRAAEQAEMLEEKAQIPQANAEEKLKKELDDSRYQEM